MENIDITPMDIGDEETRKVAAPISRVYQEPQLTAPTPVVKQQVQNTPTGKNGIWSVRPDQIDELPEFYPVERTAVFVPDESPSDISGRISGELRDRSIEAHFDEDDAKAKCVTMDGVEFRVRMYRGRGKFSHGTIVEVQRRNGLSLTFHADAMAILDRAEGKEVPPLTFASRKRNLPLVNDHEDDYQPHGSSSLSAVAKMLAQPGHDCQYLGLQSLSSLTDSGKVGSSTARAVSQELLKSTNVACNKVLSFILDSHEEDDVFKLRTLSMTILANALCAVGGDIPTSLRERLAPVLLQDLRNAEKNQRAAVLAAKCIEMMLSVDKDSISYFTQALQAALEVGRARHLGLERQVQKCLRVQ